MERRRTMEDFFYFFTYGIPVKIKVEGDFKDCVMILNSYNNFFLDFVCFRKNLKILNQIFILHMWNFRKKEKKNIIQMRLEDAKKSFYIKYEED